MWTHDKDGITRKSHTFILFWLRKTAVTVEIFQLSFRVFACAFPMVISSIFGKSFLFPFPYFVLFVLRYFPFLVSHYTNIHKLNPPLTFTSLSDKIWKPELLIWQISCQTDKNMECVFTTIWSGLPCRICLGDMKGTAAQDTSDENNEQMECNYSLNFLELVLWLKKKLNQET